MNPWPYGTFPFPTNIISQHPFSLSVEEITVVCYGLWYKDSRARKQYQKS